MMHSRPILPHDVLTGDLAPLGESLLPPDDARPDARADRPLDALLTPDGLAEAVGTLGHRLGSDDRGAVTSYWTLTYFGRLIPGMVAVAFAAPGPVGVTLDPTRAAVRLSDDGTIAAFRLGRAETPRPPGVRFLEHLIHANLEPAVEALAAWSGLAPRLLWNNAAHYYEWMMRRVMEHPAVPATVVGDVEAFLTSERLSDGTINPLWNRIVYRPSADGPVRRRKVCCLRYRLPGVGDCATLCPSPEVRKSA